MADWLHCNTCFKQPGDGKMYYITSCGHLFCEACEEKGWKSKCFMCGLDNPKSVKLTTKAMPPPVDLYLSDITNLAEKLYSDVKKFNSVAEFQQSHRKRFTSWLQKASESTDSANGSSPVPSTSAPHQTQRGRARRKSRGRRGASSSSTRGARSRSRGADIEEATATTLLQDRDDMMKDKIKSMTKEQLEDLCLKMVSSHPGLIFNILKPAESVPEGFHPPSGSSTPEWCVCGQCRQMPKAEEKVCCGYRDCISLLPNFRMLILDQEVLAFGRTVRRDVLVYEDQSDENKAYRHQAYRQYIMWEFGKLGAGVRMVIPSCAVWAIRDRYPDAFGQYTGFTASRFM